MMHHPGHHVRAAGGGAAPENQAQAQAQQNRAVDRTQQHVVRQRRELEQINEHGKQHRGNEGADDTRAPHGPVTQQKQGQVQQHAGHAHGQAEQIIQNRGHARQSARCNGVGHQKQRVCRAAQHAAHHLGNGS